MKEMLSEELLLQIKSHNDKGRYFEQYDPTPVIDRMYHDIRSLQQQVKNQQYALREAEHLMDLRDRYVESLEQQVGALTDGIAKLELWTKSEIAITEEQHDNAPTYSRKNLIFGALDVLRKYERHIKALQSIKESPREEQGK